MAPKISLSRREFVKTTGGLLIGFSIADAAILPQFMSAAALPDVSETPSPARLDAWLRIEKDETIRVFTGKAEIGMGVQTAFTQIVAEELDVSPARVAFIMGDTAETADQGGVGGSTSVAQGANPLRNAAATARLMLVQLASSRLGIPQDQLQVKDGIVSMVGDPSRNVSYGALAGGTDLNDALSVTGAGFGLNVKGAGKPKDPATYTVVGQSIPRVDMPPKILGQFQYVGDVRVPGMLHGRVIRPAGVGAALVKIDESSVKGIPGVVKIVANGNFVGVVAESEWSAIRAAKALKVDWSASAPAFSGNDDLYRHMRAVAPSATKEMVNQGDAAATLQNAAKKLDASYNWPFQSHASMGPGCAVVDFQPNGVTTIWSGAQKPHALQQGIAELLHLPPDKVHVIWMEDAGSYGRGGYEDTAGDAALLSQAVGKPVRVQWMRADMTAWGAKGPAVAYDLSAGFDAQGTVNALQFTSRAFSGTEIIPQPTRAGNMLAAQLTGVKNLGNDEFATWGTMAPPYHFAHLHAVGHIVPTFYPSGSPLRSTHLRDPGGPGTTFAVESFMDELAAAAGADPIEFRLQYIGDDARAKAVLASVVEHSGWEHRVSPNPAARANNTGAAQIATGRGIGLSMRNGTYVATVAYVDVNRTTGVVRVKRFVCVHDCGLIINPNGLRAVISANLIQSLSRALKEEVRFDRSNVTSVDWETYPVARSSDIPEQIDIVLLNHPEMPAGGAGEPSSRATAAAIANAVFDATGIRVRQAPLSPARVKAALAAVSA